MNLLLLFNTVSCIPSLLLKGRENGLKVQLKKKNLTGLLTVRAVIQGFLENPPLSPAFILDFVDQDSFYGKTSRRDEF